MVRPVGNKEKFPRSTQETAPRPRLDFSDKNGILRHVTVRKHVVTGRLVPGGPEMCFELPLEVQKAEKCENGGGEFW